MSSDTSNLAVSIRGLSKAYRIEHEARRHSTLAEAVLDRLRSPFRRAPSETFWALQDVSLDVARGEVVGIIGRNGAGKSTLLKILSRITEPTSGVIDLYGRVGSLLEVGTGFHGELTGRENIYLNGAILGMSKLEIRKHFDAIVDFAGVERFLDTPVKRYSSGMYVRLAFAVAAHLNSEILIVDEVLAVGDTAFQEKCIGKMGEVVKDGRTVLFVSHNMGVVNALCSSAIRLKAGKVEGSGRAADQVAAYLRDVREGATEELALRRDREGSGRARIVDLKIVDGEGRLQDQVMSGQDVTVEIRYRCQVPGTNAVFALSCFDDKGIKIFHADTSCSRVSALRAQQTGTVLCRLPRLPLPRGQYTLNAAILLDDEAADHVYAAGTLNVAAGDFFRIGRTCENYGAMILANYEWVAPADERFDAVNNGTGQGAAK